MPKPVMGLSFIISQQTDHINKRPSAEVGLCLYSRNTPEIKNRTIAKRIDLCFFKYVAAFVSNASITTIATLAANMPHREPDSTIVRIINREEMIARVLIDHDTLLCKHKYIENGKQEH